MILRKYDGRYSETRLSPDLKTVYKQHRYRRVSRYFNNIWTAILMVINVSSFPEVDAGNGVIRQVLADSPELMLVEFRFKNGGVGAPHSHVHVQSTYVKSGKFEFTISDKSFTVSAGDAFVIPSNAIHSCRALEVGVLVDTFTPRREDFL